MPKPTCRHGVYPEYGCRLCELEDEAAKLLSALDGARTTLTHIANWRAEARAYDRDMGHPVRSFTDNEDWKNLEEYAKTHLPEVPAPKGR